MMQPRTLRLVLVTMFALGAAASSAQAASAPYFTIGGTRLAAGRTHNFDARAVRSFVLTTLGPVITCTSFSVEKGVLLGSNAGLPGKDDEVGVFTGCTVAGNGAGCTVKQPVKTNPLSSELVEIDGPKEPLGEEFKPTTGAILVTIEFEGTCTFQRISVGGEMAAEVLTDNGREEQLELGQQPTEATSWLVKFPATAIEDVLLINSGGTKEVAKLELEAEGSAAFIQGTALTLLANAHFEPEPSAKWSPLP